MKRVIIAGGSCGSSMEQASEKIREKCRQENIQVKVKVHSLWQSMQIDPRADLVIEMFPFFKQLDCPLLNGRPFITGNGESELLQQITDKLKQGE